MAALVGCTCQDTVQAQRYACKTNDDCATNFICRGGECRSNDVPPGVCFSGETRACAVNGCESACGRDGGIQPCAPATGGGFATNPQHCGECGRQCTGRLPGLLGCVDSRCACSADDDCPAGEVCNASGLCTLANEPCAKVRCPQGQVCRQGSCTAVPCDPGCDPGEICDSNTVTCRPISGCRVPTSCGDGGICEGDPKPDGERCDDGDLCSANDVCTAGTCSGVAYTCPMPNGCQSQVTCAGDGGCDVVALPDGIGCSDSDDCTFGDTCLSGQCTGTAYTCTAGFCASSSVCTGDGGCATVPRNVGLSCDDTLACTFGDVCGDAGTCLGAAYVCPGVTECNQAGTCLGDGGCATVPKANGTACDAGLGCTLNDSCAAGLCTAGTAATSYQDLDGDGRGNANITQALCPLPGGFVLAAGDCNDGSAFVQNQMAAVQDLDQDGFTGSLTLTPTACVGATMTLSGRTYYRDVTGAYTWLAAASVTLDCNDNSANVNTNQASMVVDADHDGYSTAAAATTVCAGASAVFNGRTYYADTTGAFVYLASATALGVDCLDTNAIIFRSVANLYADYDQDGYTASAAAAQCVGLNATVAGRTYYQNSAGGYAWGASSLGADCNDASAAVLGATNWYLDADGDTFGAGAATVACSAPTAQYVASSTDCNDGNGFVYTPRSVYTDADQDGWVTAAGLQAGQCTGNASTVGGRTYYRDTAGTSTWGASTLGTDCNDASAAIQGPTTWYRDADGDGFGTAVTTSSACSVPVGYVGNSTDCNDANPLVFNQVNNSVVDNDRDGYPPNNTQTAQCAGATSTVGSRTYYQALDAGYFMGRADCIVVAGSNCQAPFDCYDQNNSAFPGQTSFFTANRGDGNFDYDCSGTIVGSPASGTYCNSLSFGVTRYTDATCVTTSGTFTQCNTPTAYSLPGACGKRLSAGTSEFVVSGVCTTATGASGTTVSCH